MSQLTRSFTNSGPGGFVQTLTGNTGGAVPPTAGNINVVGTGDITVTGTPGTSTLTISTSGAVGDSFPTDSGTATPAAGILNIFGGTLGRDINTSGVGNTIHVDLNNAITLGDLAVIAAGSNALSAVTGDINITAGNLKLPNTNVGGTQGEIRFGGVRTYNNFGSGGSNNFWGNNSGNLNVANTGAANNGFGGSTFTSITSGQSNNAFGNATLQNQTTGSQNSAFGGSSGTALNTGGNNSLFGYQSGVLLQSGNSNSALGYQAGSAWGAAVSNNIAIGNIGSVADSGRIRIGTNGTQTSCFITGIDGVNVGSVAKVVTMASDQLGTATITAGTNITVTPTANVITISGSTTPLIPNYTTVNTTPYVVTSTDYYMSVDTSTIAITIQLPNAPTQYRTFIIKDSAGNAFARNVTVTTVGGVVIIEGATSYTMNTNYAAINLLYDGVGYQIY